MIYFLREQELVNIGYARLSHEDLMAKLGSLYCGNHRPLILVGLARQGSARTEKKLHDLFAPWRVKGEWFELSRPIRYTIDAANSGALPPELIRVAGDAVKRSQAFRVRNHGSEREPVVVPEEIQLHPDVVQMLLRIP